MSTIGHVLNCIFLFVQLYDFVYTSIVWYLALKMQTGWTKVRASDWRGSVDCPGVVVAVSVPNQCLPSGVYWDALYL